MQMWNSVSLFSLRWLSSGITGILMSAAGLPVCLTRPPKLVLHPPPVSKSDIKPVPGLGHCCRKTTKKQARKGGLVLAVRQTSGSSALCLVGITKWQFFYMLTSIDIIISCFSGKTPEEVVKRYLQKVRNPPEEVSSPFRVILKSICVNNFVFIYP